MKALITGGAGFIGSHLVDVLLKRGDDVTIIDDLSTGKMENFEHVRSYPNFHFAVETIMNEGVMDRLVSQCDVIYHLASAVGVQLVVKHPVEVIERCVLGTHVVLKTANRYMKKVLLTSTSEIYGKRNEVPFSEEDDRLLGPTTKSRWSYSSSKAIDEFLALAYFKDKGLPVVIARLFNTIGPRQSGQYGMVVPRFIKQALSGKPITVYGDGKQSRCFCHVEDTVNALMGLMTNDTTLGEIFNVGSQVEVTIQELADKVRKIVGGGSKIKFVPYDKAYETGFEDMARRVPNIAKINKYIGWKPINNLAYTLNSIVNHMISLDDDRNGRVKHQKMVAA